MKDIVSAIDDPSMYASSFPGSSWDGWRAVLRAAFALPMGDDERTFFHTVADRDPPARKVKELWVVAGRRAGKDSIASVIATHTAAMFEGAGVLRRGERALVACLACDRDQAGIVLNYVKALFESNVMLRRMVVRDVRDGLELNNGVDITVATNSFRSLRGRAVLMAILDECAFYRDEASAEPDIETYRALQPGTATIADAMIVGISSPYRKAGLLHDKWVKHYGKDDDKVLVIRAPSIALNPTLSQADIDERIAADPAAAAAEWLAEWRDDLSGFVDREAVMACVSGGIREREPQPGLRYIGFIDPSGGRGDDMVLAIGHSYADTARIDLVDAVAPPFEPSGVVDRFVSILKRYGVSKVTGDRYGTEWVQERFREKGIAYEESELNRSQLYLEMLGPLNSGKISLLDDPKTINQICALERKTTSGGDKVDHPIGAHDDRANAVAGVIALCLKPSSFDSSYSSILPRPDDPQHDRLQAYLQKMTMASMLNRPASRWRR